MGPIQTAFSDFFTEVLEQEREKIAQELIKTKQTLNEDKKKEKVFLLNNLLALTNLPKAPH